MPAGTYLVHADIDIAVGSTAKVDTSSATCEVGTIGSGYYPYNLVSLASMGSTGPVNPGAHGHLGIDTVVTLSQPGPLGVYCPGDIFSWNSISGTATMTAQLLH